MASFLHSLSLTEADALMIPVGTILFFVFYRSLSPLLFKPLVELIEERERRTTGAEDESDVLRERTQEVLNRIDVKTSLADAQYQAERRTIIEKARSEAARIIEATEQRVAELLKQKRFAADEECAQVRVRTFAELNEVAESVAGRALEPSSDYIPLN